MRVFTTLPQENLGKVGPAAQAIEAAGYTGVSTQENVRPGDIGPPPDFTGPFTDTRFLGTNSPPGALGDYAGSVGSDASAMCSSAVRRPSCRADSR